MLNPEYRILTLDNWTNKTDHIETKMRRNTTAGLKERVCGWTGVCRLKERVCRAKRDVGGRLCAGLKERVWWRGEIEPEK